jgi:signal transduction histidine kinase
MLNQLMILQGYLSVSRPKIHDPAAAEMVRKAGQACDNMARHLNFTRDYLDIGARSPIWMDAAPAFIRGAATVDRGRIVTDVKLEGLVLYADPMMEKVFHNLVDNSVRHGKGVSRIEVDYRRRGDEVIITYRDDGVGLDSQTRAGLFSGHTTHGMNLANEILHITGMDLAETGEGKGARFEIRVPAASCRVQG